MDRNYEVINFFKKYNYLTRPRVKFDIIKIVSTLMKATFKYSIKVKKNTSFVLNCNFYLYYKNCSFLKNNAFFSRTQ